MQLKLINLGCNWRSFNGMSYTEPIERSYFTAILYSGRREGSLKDLKEVTVSPKGRYFANVCGNNTVINV